MLSKRRQATFTTGLMIPGVELNVSQKLTAICIIFGIRRALAPMSILNGKDGLVGVQVGSDHAFHRETLRMGEHVLPAEGT